MIFLVHTNILARELEPFDFIQSLPKLLADANVTNVQFKEGYVCPLPICHCTKDRKLMCVLEAPDENTVRSSLTKIELPITAILAKPN